jgi:hypothetical protein
MLCERRASRALQTLGAAVAALAISGLATTQAEARRWVGDLVYCDANANGTFDPGEAPLDGVGVDVVCTDDLGVVCADYRTETGTLHESTDGSLFAFEAACGAEAGWDPMDPTTHHGRYLIEVLAGCIAHQRPFACEVSVDPATLPADCNRPVTPLVEGFPFDDNGDGDACDAEDGPFPEGQPLGNIPSQGGCEAYPDPLPGDGVYHVVVGELDVSDRCSLYNDFGYTGERATCPGTRTPGFYKVHPDVLAALLPISYCGRTVDDVCEAVRLMRSKGPGSDFARHMVAASLNCKAFGCSDEITAKIAEANAACARRSWRFDYQGTADMLATYNESCHEVPFPFEHEAADPKFCRDRKPWDHKRHEHHRFCRD